MNYTILIADDEPEIRTDTMCCRNYVKQAIFPL